MGIEGRLSIDLRADSGRVGRVGIVSSRPVHSSRVFHGREVAEVQKMLPVLFSICGTAQACAGARASEQALGVSASAHIERLRESLVRMETLREHLWRILLDWPEFLDEKPEKSGMTTMLTLQRDYRQALTAGNDPFLRSGAADLVDPAVPHQVIRRVAVTLGQAVFTLTPTDWLDIHTPEELEKWAASGRTVAARLLYHVLRKGWSNVGDCEVEALPDMEISRLHQVMQDDGFIEQPLWFGDCRETTCYTRVDSPLLQRLRTRHGKGLLVRLVARLTEIAQLSMDLLPETVVAGEDFPVNVGNPGIGQVAAARGQLVHRVCLEGERVVDYRILAPTEWNFHPQGVVARALATLCGDRVRMERQARLLINAIDPCVGYELSIG